MTITGIKKLATSLVLVAASASSFAIDEKETQVNVEQHDLTLMLRAALNHNPRSLEKRNALIASGHSLTAEQWRRGPTATLTYEDFDQSSPYGTVRINQPIFAFWRIQSGIDAAEYRELAAAWDFVSVQRTLMEETAIQYLRLQQLTEQINVLKQTSASLEELQSMIEKRQQGGVASSADVNLANSRLVSTQAQLQQSKGDLRVTQDRLRNLTRLHTIVANDPLNSDFSNILEDSTVKQNILAFNPDLNRQQAELESTKASSDQSMSSLFPSLYGRLEHDLDEPDNPVSTYDRTRYGLVLEYELDGAGVTSYQRYKRSISEVSTTEAILDQDKLDLNNRVDDLITERELQKTLTLASDQAIDALEQTKASYLRQYDAGRKSWLDVLNIVRELSTEQLTNVNARNAQQTADIQLAILSGQLDTISLLEHPEIAVKPE